MHAQPPNESLIGPPPAPAVIGRVASLARDLLTRGGTLQSNNMRAPVDRELLRLTLAKEVDPLAEREPSNHAWAVADDLLQSGERAISAAEKGESVTITAWEFASLEAIVRVLGRPAMKYNNNRVEMPRSDLGDNDRWRVLVAIARSRIDQTSASVGRISTSGRYGFIGTGWRIGPDLLVTNRHVAKKMADNPTEAPNSWRIPSQRWFVRFDATDGAPPTGAIKIKDLAYIAPEDEIDFAVLQLDSEPALPPALPIDWSADALGLMKGSRFSGTEVYVVGHPFRRFASAESAAVFGRADGTKRCSPGVVVRVDATGYGFEHDCSTLGGNSGSCVLSVSKHLVVGLHHGGRDVDEGTGRGAANLALALSRLVSHRAGEILKNGHV